MDNNSKKTKKIVTVADYISISFGICGVIFGVLSLCALASFGSESSSIRNQSSFIFTIITLSVDSISVSAALVSFIYGYRIYKTLNKNETDLIKAKLVRHERKSFVFDMVSFVIGIIGMGFGLTSLLTITPWENDRVSKIVTGVGIIFDTLSSIMIVLALSEYAKYNDAREIAIYLREHDLGKQLKAQLSIRKLKITPKRDRSLRARKENVPIGTTPLERSNKNRTDA